MAPRGSVPAEPSANNLGRSLDFVQLEFPVRDSKRFALALVMMLALPAFADSPANPFHRFFGEWTLKNDDWKQNWGNGNEAVKIPDHYTVSKPLNTNNSVLSIVDTPPPETVSPFSLTPLPSIEMSWSTGESFLDSTVTWPGDAVASLYL